MSACTCSINCILCCQVTVTLLDVNDNAPEFTPSFYTQTAQDNYQANRSIITVMASDADMGVNAQITYEIINSTRRQTTCDLPSRPANQTATGTKLYLSLIHI